MSEGRGAVAVEEMGAETTVLDAIVGARTGGFIAAAVADVVVDVAAAAPAAAGLGIAFTGRGADIGVS